MNHRYNVGSLASLPYSRNLLSMQRSASVVRADPRIVWIRPPFSESVKTDTLVNGLSNTGFDIWFTNLDNLSPSYLLCFDMIILETSKDTNQSMPSILANIRLGSRAPLLVLTEGQPREWAIDTIRAGADAIVPLDTADDVIYARCNALLRRSVSNVQ